MNLPTPFRRHARRPLPWAWMFNSLLTCICLLTAAGCRSTNWEALRHSESEKYRGDIQKETQTTLASFPSGLVLTDCVIIAKERNTKLISSRIATKMAGLDKNIAFSAFLPQVQLNYDITSLSEPQALRFDNQAIETQDQNFHDSSVRILQPIFTPNAWLLYRSAKHGEDIAALVQERTAQMIELFVVNLFYQYCAFKEDAARRDDDLAAARQQLKETEAYFSAGYVTEADLAQVRALTMNSERAGAAARRDLKLAQARLMQAMNLWPLTEVNLKTDSLLGISAERFTVRTPGMPPRKISARDLTTVPVQEWMFHAMASRPEMHVKDMSIALRRNEVLMALAMFLPNLTGFANYYTTSDSYIVNQQYWGTGLQASLSAFSGFKDINAYFKAREALKSAYVEREETTMAILLQAIEAYKNLKDTRQTLDVAEALFNAAESKLADSNAQYESGVIELSGLLHTQAVYSEAMARQRTAAFANAVALYVFRNVMGGNMDPA